MRLRLVLGLELEQGHLPQDQEELGQDPRLDPIALHHQEAVVYHRPQDLQQLEEAAGIPLGVEVMEVGLFGVKVTRPWDMEQDLVPVSVMEPVSFSPARKGVY